MRFEGEFRVPGKAAHVIKRFEDVPRMARCMPGAVLDHQADDGSWPGAMVVSFGPKKIAFKGKAICAFDEQTLTGSVHGRGTANMRAARIAVNLSFALADVTDNGAAETLVKIVSEAELGGVLEDFARTGGIAVANAIMSDFARRASEEFAKDEVAPETAAADTIAISSSDASVSAPQTSTATARVADTEPATPLGQSSVPVPTPTTAAGIEAKPATAPRTAASDEPATGRQTGPQPTQAAKQPAVSNTPLAAHGLLWIVLKAYWARFLRALGLARA